MRNFFTVRCHNTVRTKADLCELKKFAYRSYFKHSFGYQINVFALEGVVKLTWDRQTDRRLHMQVKKIIKSGGGVLFYVSWVPVLELVEIAMFCKCFCRYVQSPLITFIIYHKYIYNTCCVKKAKKIISFQTFYDFLRRCPGVCPHPRG